MLAEGKGKIGMISMMLIGHMESERNIEKKARIKISNVLKKELLINVIDIFFK